jgi:hypothetical protein
MCRRVSTRMTQVPPFSFSRPTIPPHPAAVRLNLVDELGFYAFDGEPLPDVVPSRCSDVLVHAADGTCFGGHNEVCVGLHAVCSGRVFRVVRVSHCCPPLLLKAHRACLNPHAWCRMRTMTL